MAIKKSDLYSSLWASCDELRGGMDASQYKDYVLVLLFVKYVSDKYAGQKDPLLDVPKGGSFADIRQLAERYATPLAQLTDELATLAARVDGHLKKMGAVWK